MRRVVPAMALALVLSGCGLLGGSDPTESPVDVDAVADVNADLVVFRCVESAAGGDDRPDDDSAEAEDGEAGWSARGRIENSSPLARSYLVIAYAGEPGVEVEASTHLVEDIAPGEAESFTMDEVAAQPGASGCFVRVEEYTDATD